MGPDLYGAGISRGWKLRGAHLLKDGQVLETEVAIIGSGSGGGRAVEILSQAGLDCLVIEKGPLLSNPDFRMLEREAYPNLYQESADRKTKHKYIKIFQGRNVGGSSTVNWATCFRTPKLVLEHWAKEFGLQDLTLAEMTPYFEEVEARYGVSPWQVPPNRNNQILAEGCQKLGYAHGITSRNVKGCLDLGACGLGCPVGAKQSTLVTSLPAALELGAGLVYGLWAESLLHQDGKITGLVCRRMDSRGNRPTPDRITIKARHFVLAGGAINSPALLLRSQWPDPKGLLGKRTFLHPTCASVALMKDPVNPWSGAPQSVYSDHFLGQDPARDVMGFKLEVPPLHPLLAATNLTGWGQEHRELMSRLSHAQASLALLRDGFHPDSAGGQVELRGDGSPELFYEIKPYVFAGFRQAWQEMARIQFAAGAQAVMPLHEKARLYQSEKEALAAISQLPLEHLYTKVVSAHVMGGCAMAGPNRGLVDSWGKAGPNLTILDGSLLPTSLGVNPQITVLALASRGAKKLALELKGGT